MSKSSKALLATLSAILVLPPVFIVSCDRQSNQNQSLTGCLDGLNEAGALVISTTIIPVPSSSSAILSGSVPHAPCGVHGVSVLGAFSASPAVSTYAAWSVTVPMAALETQASCAEAGTGAAVVVSAQAQVVGDPGTPDGVISNSACVSLEPSFSGSVCNVTPPLGCKPPNNVGVPWNWELPLGPWAPARFDLYVSPELVGRAITWKSAAGLTNVQQPSPVIPAFGDSGSNGGPSPCCDARQAATCAGDSYAIIAPGTNAGVDTIAVTMDGRLTPVAIWSIAVQGSAQFIAAPSSLVIGDSVVLTVKNPLQFLEACTFTLPESIVLSASNDPDAGDGGWTALAACATGTSAPGSSCSFSEPAFSDSARQFLLSSSYVASIDAGVDAAAPSDQIVVVCTDEFGQVGTQIVAIGLPGQSAAAGQKDSGGGGG